MTEIRQCKNCTKEFEVHHKSKKFCTSRCKDLFCHRKSQHIPNHLSTGTTGAMIELLVSADLIRKGYYVFRNVGPHGPCDIIAMKNNKQYLIEVKTKSFKSNGEIRLFKPVNPNGKYDIVAYGDFESVVYNPPLE